MVFNKLILIGLALIFSSLASAQDFDSFFKPSDSLNPQRRNLTIGIAAGSAVGGLVALNSLWYKDYQKSSFHFINDNAQWLQMDKVGHGYGTYHLSKFSSDALRWSGVDSKQSLWYGAATGFVVISAIEIMDGYSAKWGASVGDLAANFVGSATFAGQELLWNEQRIIPKFSFSSTTYAAARPDVLGKSYQEQILKDYNGQTYWLSANIHSFAKNSKIPKWLNVAVGYGAEGMITGDDVLVNTVFLPADHRYRQYFISLDVDMTKIPTKSHFLQTVFSIVNTIKIPAPTVEFTSDGKTKFHGIYF